tara:strand:- start:247 stop:507 length:261 start_codon:yes stop_codon:yes gene_type:complete
MNIKLLNSIIKKKIETEINIENILIEDKTFLHTKHKSHQAGKYHLKISITSEDLKKIGKIQANRKVYSVLEDELKKYIHSIQILIF